MNVGRSVAICTCAALIAIATLVHAVEKLELNIASIAGHNWQADDVIVEIVLQPRDQQAIVRIRTVRFAQFAEPLRNVRIECPSVEISTSAFACSKASLLADLPVVGAQSLIADLRYGRDDGSLDIRIDGLKLQRGTVAVRAGLHDDQWSARAALRGVPIDALLGMASAAKVPLPLTSASGVVTADMRARGVGSHITAMNANGAIAQLTANNESGSLATDQLGARFELGLSKVADGWSYETEVVADRGQGYAEPIFLDFGLHAFALTARGKMTDAGQLIAETVRLSHADVMNADARVALDLEQQQPLRELELKVDELIFPGAYDSYLQPLLLDTSFKALRTKGRLSGEVSVKDGEPQRVALSFAEFEAASDQPSVAIRGLSGEWHWSAHEGLASDAPRASHLTWAGGGVYGLDFGASSLEFVTEGRNFRLLSAARIPLLDGAVQLDRLQVRDVGAPSVSFLVDATLHPISVQRLCQAFDWPEFGGSLSGTLSNLRMDEGVLTLGTTLEAQVFDGRATVKDLRLEQPFGKWPRFYADMGLHNLDLELVTSAFSFGRITGRLSGAIAGLELFNWAPIAFDARLFTPSDDRSRHRISQRAVENIGSIGGGGAGVGAALSSGFLRFFDEFNYARLGITCKLENEVCEMSGVGPAPNGGYYLVQGRGLPRIDVIGNARRVDWPRLVQQLIDATKSGGPVVD